MIFDHNKDHVADWVQEIFSDPIAAQYAQGVAFHWVSYDTIIYVLIRACWRWVKQYSGNEFENLAKAHEIAPNKFLLGTEATEGHFFI